MATDISQPIIDCLKQEVEWVTALNDVLLKEKQVLESNQFDELNTIAETKQKISENLEKSSRQRVLLLQINPNSPEQHRSALDKLLKALPEQEAITIKQLNDTLSQQLTLCRERNSINGQVIATNLTVRKEIVNGLLPEQAVDESQATYNAQGDVKKNPNSGSFQEV